mgnify:CR=1 FL=1
MAKVSWQKLIGANARTIVRGLGVVAGVVIALVNNTAAKGCEAKFFGIPTNSEQLIGAILAFGAGIGGAAVMKAIELKFGKR